MKRMVIWPIYLDATRTRKEGRIIKRKGAVKSPKIEEIEKAASFLELDPVVEEEKKHPRFHWEQSGRVLVNKVAPKTKIAKDIAEWIKGMRGRE